MPDDSNGIYNVPAGTLVNTGDTVLPSQHNPWANDSAAAISNRFSKDGRAPATGNWNLNTFRLTAVGDPVANQDATNKAYVDALTAAATMPFLPRGHINGLTLSNNAVDAVNDIDISSGQAASDTTFNNMILNTSITKRLDAAWAVGTGAGGLDTGSIANTTYHVFLIQRSDTGVVDALFSTSETSPTMPTSYDRKRRIGSIIRSGGAILAFRQISKRFLLSGPITIRSATVGAIDILLTCISPLGIKTRPIIQSILTGGTGSSSNLIGDGDNATASYRFQDVSAGVLNTVIETNSYTNTSSQVRFSCQSTGSFAGNTTSSLGWYDDLI